MKKTVIIISVCVIIIGAGLAYWGIWGRQDISYTKVSVERGEVVQNVSVTGTVISAKQINLGFETTGKVDNVAVKVGDSVLRDQVLISLDAAELNAQLQAGLAAVNVAQAKLTQTLTGSRPEDIQVYQAAADGAEVNVASKEQALIDAGNDADNDLDEAHGDALDATRTAYTKVDRAIIITYAAVRKSYFDNENVTLAFNVQAKENIVLNDLSLAESYLETAETNSTHGNIGSVLNQMKVVIVSARDALAYLRSALDDTSVSSSVSAADETSVDTERTNIDTQLTSLTSAEQSITSTEADNRTNINVAQANLDAANSALEKAQDELTLVKAGPRQTDIDLAQAELDQAWANYRQSQEKVNKTILKAPMDGVVTAIEKEEGETAQASSIIVSMMGTEHFQIEANISETDIAKVNLEDGVEITLDALGPSEIFTGQIIEIDPAETVISGVIYYKIASVFDVEDERIKSGMTANLDIQTNRRDNVLCLPYYLIQRVNGQRYVKILENGEAKEKAIKIGLEGEMNVEILEGLKEGDEVVIEQ